MDKGDPTNYFSTYTRYITIDTTIDYIFVRDPSGWFSIVPHVPRTPRPNGKAHFLEPLFAPAHSILVFNFPPLLTSEI